jgi:predicted ArsR family transcriptional regulator
MSGINKIQELLNHKKQLCVKEIAKELQITRQHADRLFNVLSKYDDIIVLQEIVRVGTRDFLVKYLKKKV